MLLFVLAVATVLVVSFLCSIFESVLLSLTRPQIELMIGAKKRAGKMLAEFKDNMDVPIAAILILNTAAHTIGAAVAGASYTAVFGSATLWVFSLVFTLAVLLFTEIIPKTVGVANATSLATPVAYGISWLSRLLWPLVILSEKLSRSIRGDVELPVTSVEEIRLLALLGRTEGSVGPRTAGVIVGAAQLPELHTRDVMLPRDKVHFLSATMSRSEVIDYVRKSGHSRFPFSSDGNLDEAKHVVLAKQLFDWLLENPRKDIDWASLAHEILVVPESLTLPKLLHTFQESHRHLSLVVDEYGGVQGIVTLEDVLEEVVGDIRDESDSPADEIRKRADGSVVVKGSVDLRQLSSILEVPWQPAEDVASVGGLVTETLERMPKVGDSIEWNGFRIEVLRADRTKARWLRVVKDPTRPAG